MFNHFEVTLGLGVSGTVKQMFSISTLCDCECIEGEAPGRSQVAAILEQQSVLKRAVDDLTVLVAPKEVDVVTLKSELQKVLSREPGPDQVDDSELWMLRAESDQLKTTNASLTEEVQALNKQLIKSHEDAKERVMLLLQTLQPPSPSS